MCKLPGDDEEFAKLNFLRYPKGNRDEWYTRLEIKDRISGTFTKVEMQRDESIVGKLNNLRSYYQKVKTDSPPKPKKAKKEDPKSKKLGKKSSNDPDSGNKQAKMGFKLDESEESNEANNAQLSWIT